MLEALTLNLPSKQILTSEQYHAHPAIGSSGLKRVLRSPAHYLHELQSPSEPTPAMQFGTICHTAILEPQVFFREMVIMPNYSGAGSRQTKENFLLENHGKIIVTPDQMDTINGMLQAIAKHESARKLLSQGNAEESYFDKCPETGLIRKVRPDYLRNNMIVDVKTTQDASAQAFSRCVANLQYHLSAALYLDVVSSVLNERIEQFLIVAVEKDAPYGVAVFLLDESTVSAGRRLYKKALRQLDQSLQSGKFPAYPDQVQSLSIPAWAYPVED